MAKSKKKTEKKKVAIYIRVSTVEQSENDFSSLDAQLNKCKTWIKRNQELYSEEYEIIDIYRDTKSGKDLKRPGITRLRKDAENGKFNLVIASKLDRVSRSLHDFLKLVSELDDDGVDIAIATQDIDTSSPAGKALQRMLLVFAEFERDMISERTKEKMFEAAKDGRWQGGYQPLGYDVNDSMLSENESESATINEIFRRYIKIKSTPKVARSLNKDGYRKKNGLLRKVILEAAKNLRRISYSAY